MLTLDVLYAIKLILGVGIDKAFPSGISSMCKCPVAVSIQGETKTSKASLWCAKKGDIIDTCGQVGVKLWRASKARVKSILNPVGMGMPLKFLNRLMTCSD